jgi:hypothetical protein
LTEQQTEIVQATIVSIGETTQYQYKDKTGKDAIGSKFSFEYTVSDSPDPLDGESPQWHREVLQIGNTYELWLKANQRNDGGSFPARIMQRPVLVTPKAANGASSKPSATTASKKPDAPPAVSQAQPVVVRPTLNQRYDEYSTHSRTAQMQATARVGQYIQLAIAGRLVTDEDEPIQNIRKSTIENWYSEEINRYWDEVDFREPNDTFGNLKDGS